jgi:hypothetical protein
MLVRKIGYFRYIEVINKDNWLVVYNLDHLLRPYTNEGKYKPGAILACTFNINLATHAQLIYVIK